MQRLVTQRLGMSVFTLALMSCGSSQMSLLPNQDSSAQAEAAALPRFQVCETSPWVPEPAQGFATSYDNSLSNRAAHPSAQDTIVVPGGDANSEAWFAYGAFRVGLVGEQVAVMRDTCNGWNTLGTVKTNEVGKASLGFNAGSGVGRFRLTSEVLGDQTAVSAHLHVLPPGTHVVVFDIDGTLTIDNFQLYMQIVDPSYVPAAFTDAAAATQAFAAKGYVPVYLTGRPFEMSAITRIWLNSQGFAPGHIHLSEADGDIAPTNAGVGEYKKAYIQSLQAMGLIVDFAYGNETTDMYAYEGAGLDPNQVYMLGPKAGYGGSQPLPDGFAATMQFINDLPNAAQPFTMQ